MFVRWKTVKRANGNTMHTAQLVEAVRVDGKPRQKVRAHLGSYTERPVPKERRLTDEKAAAMAAESVTFNAKYKPTVPATTAAEWIAMYEKTAVEAEEKYRFDSYYARKWFWERFEHVVREQPHCEQYRAVLEARVPPCTDAEHQAAAERSANAGRRLRAMGDA